MKNNLTLKSILKQTYEGIIHDHLGMIASGVAFYCFLGIFPFITLCVSLYQTFFSTVVVETSLLTNIMPVSIFETIKGQMISIESKPLYLSISTVFSITISLWTASLAMKSFLEGLDIAYDIDGKRKVAKKTLVSLVGTLLLASSFFLFFLMAAAIPVVLNFLKLEGLGEMSILIANWILLGGGLFVVISVLYQKLPGHVENVSFIDGAPGALISSLFFVISSYGFSLYLHYFANYNAIYGTLSSVIILLIWLRLMVLVVLSGAKLNCHCK